MFPQGDETETHLRSGIQLCERKFCFSKSLADMINKFENALIDPTICLQEILLSRRAKKYLGIRTKKPKSPEHSRSISIVVKPIFIYNYLEKFIGTLRADIEEGKPIFITRIPEFNFFFNARYNCSHYLGRLQEFQEFNKYEAFIEGKGTKMQVYY
jgi:hypothetical protein